MDKRGRLRRDEGETEPARAGEGLSDLSRCLDLACSNWDEAGSKLELLFRSTELARGLCGEVLEA